MMIVISNPKELPVAALRTKLVKDQADAESKATEYKSCWFYQVPNSKIAYLYILNSEWEAKQKEK